MAISRVTVSTYRINSVSSFYDRYSEFCWPKLKGSDDEFCLSYSVNTHLQIDIQLILWTSFAYYYVLICLQELQSKMDLDDSTEIDVHNISDDNSLLKVGFVVLQSPRSMDTEQLCMHLELWSLSALWSTSLVVFSFFLLTLSVVTVQS